MNVDQLQRRVDAAADAAGPEPLFPQLELQHLLPHLRLHHRVEPRPAFVPSSPYERVWAHINTLVRRIAAHAVEPVVAQQNEYNAALLDALEEMVAQQAALRARISIEQAEQQRERPA